MGPASGPPQPRGSRSETVKKEDPAVATAFSYLKRCECLATRVWSTAPRQRLLAQHVREPCRVTISLHPFGWRVRLKTAQLPPLPSP